MSYVWSASDIARIASFPALGRVLMLQCFFDDSGTHSGAKVVVWGGVVGIAEQFRDLEERWFKLLESPLPGKPPLKRFHLVDCRARRGDFIGYSDPESDHVEFLFRQIIEESAVIPVAAATDIRAWDRIISGKLRVAYRDAQYASMFQCVKRSFEYSEANLERRVSLAFDRGANTDAHKVLLSGVSKLSPHISDRFEEFYLPVKETPGLQAADMVAYYFYQHAAAHLADPNALPSPHFSHLLNNLPGDERNVQICEFYFFGENQIEEFKAHALRIRPELA